MTDDVPKPTDSSAVAGDAPAPAAVLWDMDGTLIDSEPYWIAEEYALVAEHGGTWNDERAHALIGLDLLAAAAVLRDVGSVELAPRQIVDHLSAGVMARVRAAVPWRPGARELLAAAVGAGIPCALVTMSWSELADAVVSCLPPDTFTAVVTGDKVPRGKPAPDPYLLAAGLLGLAPDACVAIEDSPTGTASAVAAGVPTVAVPNAAPVPVQPGVALVPTLEGVDLSDLARLRAAARAP